MEPRIKLPEDVKKEMIYRKDLDDEGLVMYDELRTKYYHQALIKFLDSPAEAQIEASGPVSTMLINYTSIYVSNLSPFGYRSKLKNIYQESGVKLYIKFAKNTHLNDANKFIFLRRLFQWTYANPLKLMPVEVKFNDPKYINYLKEHAPAYRLRMAFNAEFTAVDIDEIIATSKVAPLTVFSYWAMPKIIKRSSSSDLEKLFKSNPWQSSQYLGDVPKEKLEEFTPETFELLVKRNSSCFKHIPKNKITDELADLAISRSGGALLLIPKKLRTKERIEKAVLKTPSILAKIPKEEHTSRLLLKATLASPKAKKYFKTRAQ